MHIYSLLEAELDMARRHLLHMQQLLIERNVDCEARNDLWPYEGKLCLLITELMTLIKQHKEPSSTIPRCIVFISSTASVYDKGDRKLHTIDASRPSELERIADLIEKNYQLYTTKLFK